MFHLIYLIEMFLGVVHKRMLPLPQPLIDDTISPLAVQADSPCVRPNNDGHALAHVVEVQDAEQLVGLFRAVRLANYYS